jgi:hypothetical protein
MDFTDSQDSWFTSGGTNCAQFLLISVQVSAYRDESVLPDETLNQYSNSISQDHFAGGSNMLILGLPTVELVISAQ